MTDHTALFNILWTLLMLTLGASIGIGVIATWWNVEVEIHPGVTDLVQVWSDGRRRVTIKAKVSPIALSADQTRVIARDTAQVAPMIAFIKRHHSRKM